MRILIGGGPRTGKTTLAAQWGAELGAPVWSTDDLIPTHDWSAASHEVMHWIERPGPWVIEGVAVARALRKWLLAHETGTPADTVIWIVRPKVTRTVKQEAMAKGCDTVWHDVQLLLALRGTHIGEAP